MPRLGFPPTPTGEKGTLPPPKARSWVEEGLRSDSGAVPTSALSSTGAENGRCPPPPRHCPGLRKPPALAPLDLVPKDLRRVQHLSRALQVPRSLREHCRASQCLWGAL